jgi:3-phosphoshikimate 1-carboxyvinyltransferase
MIEDLSPLFGQTFAPKNPLLLPGSKSITNRAFLLGAIAQGRTLLQGALVSEDTLIMKKSLEMLGVEFTGLDGSWEIQGCGGRLQPVSQPIWLGNAGTVARFLPPVLCFFGQGPYRCVGSDRMEKERPMEPLYQALKELGAQIAYEKGSSFPLSINPVPCPDSHQTLTLTGLDQSSQFASGLCILGALLPHGLTLELGMESVSFSYLEMTLQMLGDFGVRCVWENPTRLRIQGPLSAPKDPYVMEPDASSASYVLGAAALTGGVVELLNLSPRSTQGDWVFADILVQMGCGMTKGNTLKLEAPPGGLRSIEVDLKTASDIAPTLGVVAAQAQGMSLLSSLGHLRYKECNRLAAIATELARVGVRVEEGPDCLRIWGGFPESEIPVVFDTYGDHRMAMALSLFAFKRKGVGIRDPRCVEKTFPNFFKVLRDLPSYI